LSIGLDRRQRAADVVLRGAEAHRACEILRTALEFLAVERTSALVEQGRGHRRQTYLAFGIGRGAAAKGHLERDDRQRVILHEPSLDAAWADDTIDCDGTGRNGGEDQDDEGEKPAMAAIGIM